MCRVLGVSRSRYYAQLQGRLSHRQRENLVLLAAIRAAFEESKQTYGAVVLSRNFAVMASEWVKIASGG